MIRLSKSSISNLEIDAVSRVLQAEYLGMGANVEKFESALSSYFGRPAICVGSGTAALQLALQACNVGEGDEVLVPTLTYVATFQAISANGAIPIACDVDPCTWQIDLRDAEKRVSSKTRALMPVYYAGVATVRADCAAFAKAQNIRLIEDAAHAFGTVVCGEKVGSVGDITCFSFDGIKNITAGEGGCIVSDDEAVLENARTARLLGVSGDTKQRYSNGRSWTPEVTMQGWRYHMNNISAAIGIVQLDRFEQLALQRQHLARLYHKKLGSNPLLELIDADFDQVVPHIYPVRIKSDRGRDNVREDLLKANIETGLHYFPNHLLEFFKNSNKRELPNAEKLYKEILSLPLHPDLTSQDVIYVCESLTESLL